MDNKEKFAELFLTCNQQVAALDQGRSPATNIANKLI